MPKKINMLNTSNIQNSNFANNLSNNNSIIALKNQINELQNKYDILIDKLVLSGNVGDSSLIDLSNQLPDLKFHKN